MNGWANWETWCASLWISNDEALYRTARVYGHSGYDRLIPYLQAFGETNGDGLRWDDPAIDRAEMDEMLAELCCVRESAAPRLPGGFLRGRVVIKTLGTIKL